MEETPITLIGFKAGPPKTAKRQKHIDRKKSNWYWSSPVPCTTVLGIVQFTLYNFFRPQERSTWDDEEFKDMALPGMDQSKNIHDLG